MYSTDNVKSVGTVSIEIQWKDGKKEVKEFSNRVLRSGRIAQTKALANDFGSSFEYFVIGISFGSGGTAGGSPRYIDDTRTGLFGPTITTKPVISSINSDMPTQVVFTSVLAFDEAVGDIVNEMALKLASDDYYSMATFGDITKTSSMQLTFNWKINFV